MKRSMFVATALLLSLAPAARAEKQPKDGWEYLQEVKLDIGVLAGTTEEDKDGNTLRKLKLGDRVLVEFDDIGWRPVGPIQPSDRLIPILIDTGGSGCPFEVRVVVLTDPAAPKFSHRFGNCTSEPAAIDRLPSGWRFVFDGYHGGPSAGNRKLNGKKDVFVFRDGVLYEQHGKQEVAVSEAESAP